MTGSLFTSAIIIAATVFSTPLLQFERARPQLQLRITAETGLGSYVRPEHWTMVRITLFGAEQPFSGSVEVRSTAREVEEIFTQSVDVGAGATRRLSLAVPGDSNSFDVVVRDAAGTIVAGAAPVVRKLTEDERLVVVVSDPPDALNSIGGLANAFGSTALAAVDLSDLPDRGPLLDAADVLIFRAVDTSELSAEQVRAIQSWVNAGGHLILVGGPSAGLTYAGLTTLAPATPADQTFAAAQPLAAFAAPNSLDAIPIAPSASMPAVTLTRLREDAETLVAAPETPLIVHRRIGQGSVDMLAFDPALAPLRGWPGTLAALLTLLGGHPHDSGLGAHLNFEAARITAGNLPAANIPSPLVVLVWLSLYLITLGPLNLFVLRRIRRLHFAWVTLPGITAAFIAAPLLSGLELSGNVPIAQRLTLRISHAGGDVPREISLIGAWSQRPSLHTLTTGNALVREISSERPMDAPSIDRFAFEQNSAVRTSTLELGIRTRALTAQADGVADSDIVAAAAYSPAAGASQTEDRMLATITNRSAAPLRDCTLLAGRNYRALGDIQPNQTIDAAVPLHTAHPQIHLRMRSTSLRSPDYAGRYYGSAMQVSPPESSPAADEPAPFDLNGAPLTAALVDWMNYDDDRQRKEARNGLIADFFDRDYTLPGALLSCWSDSAPAGPSLVAATTDQTLSLWQLSPRPFLIDAPQTIPADLFTIDLVDSNDRAAIERTGLQLAPGAHLLRLQPWLPLRRTQSVRATLALDLRLTPEERTDVDAEASTAAWNWRHGRFEEIAPTIADLGSLPPLADDYVSAEGGIRLRLAVRGGRVTIVRAAPTVTYK